MAVIVDHRLRVELLGFDARAERAEGAGADGDAGDAVHAGADRGEGQSGGGFLLGAPGVPGSDGESGAGPGQQLTAMHPIIPEFNAVPS